MEEKKRLKDIIEEKKSLPGGCSLMTLTSSGGNPYWFRTCDISFDLRQEGAGVIRIQKEEELIGQYKKTWKSNYRIQGITYGRNKTWLLDGINEEGLCGGLLMLSEGRGKKEIEGKENEVMAMEAVAYFLSKCKNVEEVILLAEKIEITNIHYGKEILPATVHYHFLDSKGREVVLEPTREGEAGKLCIYSDKETLGIMTNSPIYPCQKQNLSWFLSGSPEMKMGDREEKVFLRLDGKEITEKKDAYHISLDYSFPGGFASYDRFIRLAVLKAVNNSGNNWKDTEILSRGISIMNTVREPEDQGVLHYSYLKKMQRGKIKVVGREKSKTYYLVIYDLKAKKCYLQWFDEMEWTCYTLYN